MDAARSVASLPLPVPSSSLPDFLNATVRKGSGRRYWSWPGLFQGFAAHPDPALFWLMLLLLFWPPKNLVAATSAARNNRRVFYDVYRELPSFWSPAVTLVLPEPPLVQPLLGSLEYVLLWLPRKWLGAEVTIVVISV
ncbi:uncharacterized protein LOC107484258 isoform X2 [Arachis duranensis]|uniref:Uncharacterized protein LOC107484258 isoform X2 n=1 Tax=Arachis duranensis TaxID=130453 RepID=A0A9C6WHN8_ARADU|nr:uncharacterized protein LOC107484258 isoform X2 [Arachis duranensis]